MPALALAALGQQPALRDVPDQLQGGGAVFGFEDEPYVDAPPLW